jgi:predicted transcriptional regulator
MSNLENDRRAAPAPELLERIMSALLLTDEEKIYTLDLAAKSKYSTSVPIDLPDYIMEHEIVRTALRTAKDGDATDKEWEDFIKKINSRIRRERKEKEKNDE